MSCALLADRGPQIIFSGDFIWIVYSLAGCWSQSDLTTECFLLCIRCNHFIIDAIYQKSTENRQTHIHMHGAPGGGWGEGGCFKRFFRFQKVPTKPQPPLQVWLPSFVSWPAHLKHIPLPFCSLVVKWIVRNTTAELHVLLRCRFSLNFFGDQNTKTRFKVRTLACVIERSPRKQQSQWALNSL